MTRTKRTLLALLSLIGLALAIELCVVYYNANFVIDAKPSICEINDLIDCSGAARTSYSQFLGIPLSLWGVCLYLFFLFMTFADKMQNIKFLGIGVFSFLVSMILGVISIFKINAVCIFCFMTYLIDLLIAVTAKTKGVSVISEIKTSFNDFIEAVKVPRYAFWFSLLVLLGISAVTYTSLSNDLAPQIKRQKMLKEALKQDLEGVEMNGNTLGAPDAELVIEEYMDFNCGGCFMAQLYLHRAVKEFENIKIIQHNLPLDSECNSRIEKGGGHKNSCLKSRYALAAAKQNKYWQISQILFEPDVQEEKQIIGAARLLDIDIKKLKEDAHSEAVKKELEKSIQNAQDKGVDGTPSLQIGMKQMLGVGTYPEFVKAIAEQGGKVKSQYAQ